MESEEGGEKRRKRKKRERGKEGKRERWQDGKMERWKDGKMERWKDGRMEDEVILTADESIEYMLRLQMPEEVREREGRGSEQKEGYKVSVC